MQEGSMVIQDAGNATEWSGDRIKSALEQLQPSLIPGAEPEAAFKAQMLLADSQWLDRDEMQEYQLDHLKPLVRFAAREVPFWRSRIAPDVIEDAKTLPEALSRLPILARDDVHDQGEALRAKRLPKGQEPAGMASTSGSTGMTVRIASTKLDVRWQTILDLRRHLWAGLDLRRSVAAVQRLPRGVADYPDGRRHDRWGPVSAIPFPTGPAFQLATHASLEQQWEWVQRVRPAYLDAMPSLIRGYAHIAGDDARPGLECILTAGEVVDPALRSLAAKRLGAKIHDKYSTQEAGCMAIQCPDCEAYHVQSEAVILEVLDDAGKPCKPGEIGRVVVTPFFNFATPLFRYDIGDFAEVGSACSCGRSLPTLSRIMGRRRNILVAPDGKHYWPTLDSFEFFVIAQSREHQFRQVAPDVLEIWLVVDSPRTPEQEEAMRRIIAAALPSPFEIRFRYVAEFPRGPSGKHEEFISFVSDPPRNAAAG
jgi:phenylacetate-CoA ligase